jgi:hypothetical protein
MASQQWHGSRRLPAGPMTSPEVGETLPHVSDDELRQALAGARTYTVRVLKRGPNYDTPEAEAIIWEHGRRNMALHVAGVLAIMCPVRDGSEIAGVSIFDAECAEVERIMAGDPAVQTGVLTFEVHPAIGFPGDCLPGQPVTRAD